MLKSAQLLQSRRLFLECVCIQQRLAFGRTDIGNPANKITILELAEKVVAITASSSKINFVDPKALWGPMFEGPTTDIPMPTAP
jgi:hypothetical protein